MDVPIHAGRRADHTFGLRQLIAERCVAAAAHGRTAAFDIGRTCHALLRHAVGTDRLRQCGAGRRHAHRDCEDQADGAHGIFLNDMRKITRRLPETFPLRNRGRPDLS